MRLPFVSRDKYEDKLQELHITKKLLDNSYEIVNEQTQRNCRLNLERIEAEKRANKFEDWYKNLNSIYKELQSKVLLLENENKILNSKMNKFEIDFFLKNKVKIDIQKKKRIRRKKEKNLTIEMLDMLTEKYNNL